LNQSIPKIMTPEEPNPSL